MEKIRQVKDKGNGAFKSAYFQDAITFYEEALMQTKFRKSDIAKEEPNLTAEEAVKVDADKAELETIHQALLNNLAMCYQKRKEYDESCFYNDCCLELNPEHVKARYRRAILHAQDSKFDQAKEVA